MKLIRILLKWKHKKKKCYFDGYFAQAKLLYCLKNFRLVDPSGHILYDHIEILARLTGLIRKLIKAFNDCLIFPSFS